MAATATQEDLLALALARRRKREALAAATAMRAARLWRKLNFEMLTPSWQSGVGREIFLLTAGAQLASASGAGEYVDQALAAQGRGGSSFGQPEPSSLAGVAADGRSLATLLYRPVISTKMRIASGVDPHNSFLAGARELSLIVQSEVTDAGRVMDGVATVSRRTAKGYVRALMPPSCSRCVVLAGSYYSAERAFLRHPRCDCVHLPIGDKRLVNALTTSPKDYFASLTRAEQNKAFTEAGARAIREGADINQVVNARRSMYSAGRLTREAARGGVRLMPETIYSLASSRDEAISLLRRYGYLT